MIDIDRTLRLLDIDRTLRLLDVEAESNFVQAEAIDAINFLRAENARLRRLVKSAYYEGWSSTRGYAPDYIRRYWSSSKACAAIREGGRG